MPKMIPDEIPTTMGFWRTFPRSRIITTDTTGCAGSATGFGGA
jgi:hypothetical protein